MVYMKIEHMFHDLPRNFSAGLLARGGIYKKKNVFTRLSLSLSLSLSSTGRESKRRGWGELDVSNHPTAFFGQHAPLLPASSLL